MSNSKFSEVVRLFIIGIALLSSGAAFAGEWTPQKSEPLFSEKWAVCSARYSRLRIKKIERFKGCPMAGKKELIIYPVPSLVATLLNRERAKGSPLTEDEVIQIRDNCEAIAVPPDVARKMDEERGYQDIDPENCWDEWQQARKELR